MLGAVDAHHVGAQIAEQHGAKGARSDAGDLDDFQSLKRSHPNLLLPRARNVYDMSSRSGSIV